MIERGILRKRRIPRFVWRAERRRRRKGRRRWLQEREPSPRRTRGFHPVRVDGDLSLSRRTLSRAMALRLRSERASADSAWPTSLATAASSWPWFGPFRRPNRLQPFGAGRATSTPERVPTSPATANLRRRLTDETRAAALQLRKLSRRARASRGRRASEDQAQPGLPAPADRERVRLLDDFGDRDGHEALLELLACRIIDE